MHTHIYIHIHGKSLWCMSTQTYRWKERRPRTLMVFYTKNLMVSYTQNLVCAGISNGMMAASFTSTAVEVYTKVCARALCPP